MSTFPQERTYNVGMKAENHVVMYSNECWYSFTHKKYYCNDTHPVTENVSGRTVLLHLTAINGSHQQFIDHMQSHGTVVSNIHPATFVAAIG